MALTLVPFATLKAVIGGLEKATLAEYPSIVALSASVYAAFESYLGRWIEQDDYVETVYCDGHIISLKAMPIASVASVIDADGNDLTALCTVRKDSLKSSACITGEVTVTYNGGIEEIDAAHNWLTRAALLQIAHEYARKDQIGATSVTNEGGSVQWASEIQLLKEVKRLLDPNINPAKFC